MPKHTKLQDISSSFGINSEELIIFSFIFASQKSAHSPFFLRLELTPNNARHLTTLSYYYRLAVDYFRDRKFGIQIGSN